MPSLGVTVAIMKENAILLILREDFPIWCLPGGGIEPGESVVEAAVREAYEETGLKVRPTRLVGIYSRPETPQGGGHELLFAAEPISGEPRPDGKETLKVEWFPIDGLPQQLAGLHRTSIQDAISASPAVARRIMAYPTLSKLTRQELYTLRDQGKLDLKALFLELCTPLNEAESYNEIENKVNGKED